MGDGGSVSKYENVFVFGLPTRAKAASKSPFGKPLNLRGRSKVPKKRFLRVPAKPLMSLIAAYAWSNAKTFSHLVDAITNACRLNKGSLVN